MIFGSVIEPNPCKNTHQEIFLKFTFVPFLNFLKYSYGAQFSFTDDSNSNSLCPELYSWLVTSWLLSSKFCTGTSSSLDSSWPELLRLTRISLFWLPSCTSSTWSCSTSLLSSDNSKSLSLLNTYFITSSILHCCLMFVYKVHCKITNWHTKITIKKQKLVAKPTVADMLHTNKYT